MRRTRWLFLAAFLAIVIWVSAVYVRSKASADRNIIAPPKPLEAGIDARSQHYSYTKSNGTTPVFSISAGEMRESKDSSTILLQDVELHLFHKDGSQYDRVLCDHASFNESAKTLFSDGDVRITMGIPVEGPPHGRIVGIKSSGITFQSETGKAATDRRAWFDFGSDGKKEGGGTAVGVEYDPQTRELHLKSQVSLDWTGKTEGFVPMHIEAGEAFYKEKESKIWLMPWSKLTRDTLHMEGGNAVITLDQGDVREAYVAAGHGVREEPDRKIEFQSDRMWMHFADGMVVDHIYGDQNGRLVSTAATMRTTVTSPHMDLSFHPQNKESELQEVLARGGSTAEAQPLPKPNAETKETKILKSDTITLKMRNGGKEIASAETAGPGTLDFLPNAPGQPKRFLKGDRIWITYGAENRIQSLKAVNVTTRTDKPGAKDPAITESRDLVAFFDPKTSDLLRMEQKTNFKYDEGDRHARAASAVLEQDKGVMTLDGGARMWDSTGSAAADHIVTNQKTGDFEAAGHVMSTHQPDKNGKSSAMLSTEEVMQAKARRMISTDNNQKVIYEGDAVAWQGANRVEADRLQIDRDAQIMEAHGKVKSQFVDKDKKKEGETDGESGAAAPPVFTIVTAPDMVYHEENRVVEYSGGVELVRPGMTITARRIRAFLKDADQDSSLDKAFADGTVKIVSTSEKTRRTRVGASEHAEYYADEERVVLSGGQPALVDNMNRTRGNQLTWFANDDRLIVDGKDKTNPAKSVVHKKK
ncbi:MAG TPA: LptA/OstA family protein [Bryobacteraceae bacterium]|jgi:lipopolysaccharide export system protein LptA|nr:LptA/OstA family protein [Bryobacteraceae bacterium]